MVRATVKRDSPDSFTVTFGDASSPEAASGAQPNKISATSPASSKNASTANVNMRKAQAIAMAKAAIAEAKAAIDAADKAISENSTVLMIDAGHRAKSAVSNITKEMNVLKTSGVIMPDMRRYETIIIQTSKDMTGENTIQQFTDLKNKFQDAIIHFEQLTDKMGNKTNSIVNPSSAPVVNMKSWHATIEQVEADIQNVLANIDNNPSKAREEAKKLSTTITTAYKGLSQPLQNTLKEDKTKISKKISEIFKTLEKRGVPSKGGRRTHRKRTHRKRTYRKRKSIQKIE